MSLDTLIARVGSFKRRFQIGAAEIVGHEQQRQLQSMGQGIGEALPKVERAGVKSTAQTLKRRSRGIR